MNSDLTKNARFSALSLVSLHRDPSSPRRFVLTVKWRTGGGGKRSSGWVKDLAGGGFGRG
jgi:hypothetical protein